MREERSPSAHAHTIQANDDERSRCNPAHFAFEALATAETTESNEEPSISCLSGAWLLRLFSVPLLSISKMPDELPTGRYPLAPMSSAFTKKRSRSAPSANGRRLVSSNVAVVPKIDTVPPISVTVNGSVAPGDV